MSATGLNKGKKKAKSKRESVGEVVLTQVKQKSLKPAEGGGTKVRKTSSSSLKNEGKKSSSDNPKRRKAPSRPTKEQAKPNEPAENSLRRSVSPRKEQYSHLLDEVVGCGDMVLLEPLTEGNVIENLKKRYDAGDIYVS